MKYPVEESKAKKVISELTVRERSKKTYSREMGQL